VRMFLILGLLVALSQEGAFYRPRLAVPDASQPFLKHLEPGDDAFPLERTVREIDARLGEWSRALRAGAAPSAAVIDSLLAPGFRGAWPSAADEPSSPGPGPLDVQRARDLPREPTLDARAFAAELQRLTRDLREITVAEFLITAIGPETTGAEPRALRTSVRYDLVGAGTKAFRVEHVGVWEMVWRKQPSGWQVVRWTAAEHESPSSPRSPRRRSGATSRFDSSTSIWIPGWRPSTRC
jgi:hypothetical protein